MAEGTTENTEGMEQEHSVSSVFSVVHFSTSSCTSIPLLVGMPEP